MTIHPTSSIALALAAISMAAADELIVEAETTLVAEGTIDYTSEVIRMGEDVAVAARIRLGGSANSTLVARMGPAGVVWHTIIPDAGTSHFPGEISVAQNDTIFGASTTFGAGSYQLRVFGIDAAGSLKWTRDIPGDWWAESANGAGDHGYYPQVATLGDDSVVVACTVGSPFVDAYARVVRLDAVGTVLWDTTIAEDGVAYRVQDVAAAPDGSVRVVGPRYEPFPVPDALFVASILPDGTLDWMNWITGEIMSVFAEFSPTDVLIDANGDAVLIGATETTCGLFAIDVVRFDSSGPLLWRDTIPDAFCGVVHPQHTFMRPDGSVVVMFTGHAEQTNHIDFFGVGSWAADGAREWIVHFENERGASFSEGAVDAAGNVLLWASPTNPDGCEEYMFASIDRSGAIVTPLDASICSRPNRMVGRSPGRFALVDSFGNQLRAAFLFDPSLLSSADFNGDGRIDGGDLGLLIGAWDTSAAAYDLNGDGLVDGADLAVVLVEWTG